MKKILDFPTHEGPQSPARRGLLKAAAALGAAGASTAFIGNIAPASETKMTAESAADVVRKGYHAFNTADLDLFSTLSSEDLTWETPGRSPIAGLREGREAVYAQYGTYLGGTDGTFKAELQYVSSNGNGQVVGVHRNTGQRNGKTLDTMCCITFEVADGKILSGKEHFFDLYNWDQFWA
ncbi:MAG: nuclear transport factor 2 family protein [Rhodobacteraceae bacterium]|nr:nuclear transport factor 2 family protein [Paracoccaceae bacterium]